MNTNQIHDYYKKAELWLPKYPQWRIWKIRLENRRVIQIKDNIRNKDILRKYILRYNPVDVWYSSGCFMNPSKVRGNKTKNYLFFRNLVFDIDSEKPYGIEQLKEAKKLTISLIQNIKEKLNIEPEYCIYSGKKGFQVVYGFIKYKINTKEFKGIDEDITNDKYRVVRLPLSLRDNGRIATIITKEELKKSIKYIINKSCCQSEKSDKRADKPGNSQAPTDIHSSQDFGNRLGMLNKADDKVVLSAEVNGQISKSSQIESASISNYVTNQVNGTERHIPILIYPFHQKINIRNELEKLYKKYQLNTWYILSTDDSITAISLVSFDKRRLEKILNSSKSYTSREQFRKFGRIYLRTSPVLSKRKLTNPVRKSVVINFGDTSKKFLLSRPHADMLLYFKFLVEEGKTFIGQDKLKILEVVKR